MKEAEIPADGEDELEVQASDAEAAVEVARRFATMPAYTAFDSLKSPVLNVKVPTPAWAQPKKMALIATPEWLSRLKGLEASSEIGKKLGELAEEQTALESKLSADAEAWESLVGARSSVAEMTRDLAEFHMTQEDVVDDDWLDELGRDARERNARQDEAAAAAVQTAETLGQLLPVMQEQQQVLAGQHELTVDMVGQLGKVGEILDRMHEQGSVAAVSGARQFKAGFIVGVITLLVTIAGVVLSVVIWQATAGR